MNNGHEKMINQAVEAEKVSSEKKSKETVRELLTQ
jgi:hypothetical protein